MNNQVHPRETNLFLILSAFFVANALVAEFIGVKIFSVEKSLGFTPFNLSLFGIPSLSLHMSAGVILWPFVFVLTDIINEYFGLKGVRRITHIALILISYAFLMVFLAMTLVPSDFWINRVVEGKSLNMDLAFGQIFGQGLWIIAGSLTAFLVGQIIDVSLFQRIKRLTGEKALWFRATGSTVVSQFIDSFVVIFIAFYLNPSYDWTFAMVMAIGLVGYSFKFLVALFMTPVLYLAHYLIDKYLGPELSKQLRERASGKKS